MCFTESDDVGVNFSDSKNLKWWKYKAAPQKLQGFIPKKTTYPIGFNTRSISSMGFLSRAKISMLSGAITQSMLHLSMGNMVRELIKVMFDDSSLGLTIHLYGNLSDDSHGFSPQLPNCNKLIPRNSPLTCFNSASKARETLMPWGVRNQLLSAVELVICLAKDKIILSQDIPMSKL